MKSTIMWLVVLLSACGGGGSSGGSAGSSGTPPPVAGSSTLPRLFAGLTAADASASPYLKACYFQQQKIGAKGQRGLDFLESLVIEVLPAYTAPLYDASNGYIVGKTNRAYKGTDGKMGAPPALWTGVVSVNADGSAQGFGAPCANPGSMTSKPPLPCYWLVDNLNGRMAALNYYEIVSDGSPMTSSGGVALGNPGWGTAPAYHYWYEMSVGPTCSAPESTTLWRSMVRCKDLSLPECNV
ncbi:hypothetical protein V8J88_23600 [Massilia sp. W12]|uniref:hypothetical protein n=1 Tax=Massilia sp. W12 TaxID=3126507 RepID=UPI0030D58E48